MKPYELLDVLTRPGELVETLEAGNLRCLACAHRCLLKPGRRGICGVRYNADGVLMVPEGYVAGAQIDPIEKKPFNHFLPGSEVLTFGMLGCNFHCRFCQNWFSSQALRDPHAGSSAYSVRRISAERLVEYAVENGAQAIASSYNEPLISTEWAVAVFKLARQNGLKTAYVSNGYATPEVLDYLAPWLDGYKVDLKSMRDSEYRKMGGTLQPVLDTIRRVREKGLWLEVVTLVIPGMNDSSDELWETGRFLASVSAEIPWHVTAYHPDYKEDAPPTPAATLQRAAEIGQEAGLRYVYAGNLPGRVGSLEDTLCPKCGRVVISRRGYLLNGYHISAEGACAFCGQSIAGVWADKLTQGRGNGFPRRIS
ncbi:MAG TPA: AmmeMemoRadiSam system radical SAM enzyme [Anaerolineaceae bacterium]|nr:AmmeMemoRadiSam system radical SAM enzyme [Anaerolineaceae bacterium]